MFKLKRSNGFTLYDILISLVIFVLVSIFLTDVFVKNVEVSKSNKVQDACTFEAVETFEQVRSLNNGQGYTNNEYLNSFTKEQTTEDVVYTKTFLIGNEEYKEKVYIELLESYDTEKIRVATVSDNLVNSGITYDSTKSSLYRVTIKIFDENNKEVYNIETNFTEEHKVVE